MRVFVGIEFNSDVREYLYKVQNYIKPLLISGVFTNFNNFHLTTKYIGHVTEDEIEILKDCIFTACEQIQPFDIKLNGLHSFNKGRSSILWVGIDKGKDKLTKLYKAFERELISEEFDLDYSKKYRPHITVGKKMILGNQSTSEIFPHFYEGFRVSTITLFQSHRVNEVLTYTPIYRCDL